MTSKWGKAMKGNKSHNSSRWEVYDQSDVAMRVGAPAYQQFSRQIDRELEALVARWVHAAAPNASRTPDFRFRYGKPK